VEYPGHVPAIIAIDGPAGAGKSTVARKLARRLGYAMVDTGAIYRAVALAAQRAGTGWDDDAGLARLLEPGLPIAFGENDQVFLGGEDVTAAIRTPEMSRGASVVSARPVVRERLLGLQRTLGRAAQRGAVLEGRDIGTIVFPDATVKFFLTASDEARARRRHAELAGKGHEIELSKVLNDQRRRDRDDSERTIAPLRPAADAIVVDTTGLDFDEVVERCFRAVRERVAA
jgi:CMP/dCMP kinase